MSIGLPPIPIPLDATDREVRISYSTANGWSVGVPKDV